MRKRRGKGREEEREDSLSLPDPFKMFTFQKKEGRNKNSCPSAPVRKRWKSIVSTLTFTFFPLPFHSFLPQVSSERGGERNNEKKEKVHEISFSHPNVDLKVVSLP